MNKKLFFILQSNPIPKLIQGLTVWFDASDSNTITIDGSNRVSQLNDKSGNGNNVSNAGSNSTWPVWTASQINSLPTLVFTAASSHILSSSRITAIQGLSGITIFSVGGKGGAWVGQGANINERGYILNNYTDNKTYIEIAASADAYGSFSDGSQKFQKTTLIFDGTQGSAATKLKLRTSGTDRVLSFAGGAVGTVTESNVNSKFALGAYFVSPATFTYYGGHIGEVLIYNRTLTAQEISTIESYLLSKWGL